MSEFPSVFVSHGAPTLALETNAMHRALQSLGVRLGLPRAILCISAHWESGRPAVSTVEQPETIHDFGGFPRELYEIRYSAPGAPELAKQTADLLQSAGISCGLNADRGLDHGAWVPLMLMYPDANIPVTQLSVQTRLGAEAHLSYGRALAPLRREGILILASGGSVHNLPFFLRFAPETTPGWAVSFEEWLREKIEEGQEEDLVQYRARAPFAEMAHPTEEHFLPLFVAMGAGRKGRRSFYGPTLGGVNSSVYLFEG